MQDLRDIINQRLIDRQNEKGAKKGYYRYEMPIDPTDYRAKYEEAVNNFHKAQKLHEEALKAWNAIPSNLIDEAEKLKAEYARTHGGEIKNVSDFFDAVIDGAEGTPTDTTRDAYYTESSEKIGSKETEKRRYHKIEEDYYESLSRMNKAKAAMINAEFNLQKQGQELKYRTNADLLKDFKKNSLKPFLVGCCYFILIIHMIVTIVRFLKGALTLQPGYFITNPFYLVLWTVAPVGVWIWSTAYDFWNYWSTKFGTIRLIIVNVLLMAMHVIGRLAFLLLAQPVLRYMPVTSMISETSIVKLCRGLIIVPSLIIPILLFVLAEKVLEKKTTQEAVKGYMVIAQVDTRKNKQFRYDIRGMRKMKNRQRCLIKEKDRFLHVFANGATGTGKTSSVILTILEADLTQIAHNEDWQKKEVRELLDAGEVRLTRNFDDYHFSLDYVEPIYTDDREKNEKRKKKLDDLNMKAPVAGALIVAPNEELADNAHDLAVARGIRVLRIDPLRDTNGMPKADSIGFNPLYVSPLLEDYERYDDIVSKANVVSEVLSELNREKGRVDAYFEGVNSIQTVTVSKLLMLTYPHMHHGKQPTLREFQRLLNNYSEMRPYLYELVHLYGNHGTPMDMPANFDQDSSYSEQQRKKWFIENKVDCGLWHDVFTVVNNELLDEKIGPTQFERANGLRNQVNLFLNTPMVNDVMCNPKTVDLDEFLRSGGVLTVNYALKMGGSTSMAFGDFFLLSYGKAVLRRPRGQFNRPIFTIIDEFPTLLNKDFEAFFSLHRQYSCSNLIAMQSLSQFKKSDTTNYLCGLILANCAHQIWFGRINQEEMKIVEELGGLQWEEETQDMVSQTSLFSENPSYSMSSRTTLKANPFILGSDARFQEFRQCTVFTVNDGSIQRPFFAKVQFLTESEWLGHRRVIVDWTKWHNKVPEYTFGAAPAGRFSSGAEGVGYYGNGAPKKPQLRLDAHGRVQTPVVSQPDPAPAAAPVPVTAPVTQPAPADAAGVVVDDPMKLLNAGGAATQAGAPVVDAMLAAASSEPADDDKKAKGYSSIEDAMAFFLSSDDGKQ